MSYIYPVGNKIEHGTLAAAEDAVTIPIVGQFSVGFQLDAGTLIGTLVAEVSFDNGATYVPAQFLEDNDISSSLVFGAPNPAKVGNIILVGGVSFARIRLAAWTSGSANLFLSGTVNQFTAPLGRVTDGTNIAAVKAASTPPVVEDPAVVVGLSPNSSLPLTANTSSTGALGALNAAVSVALTGQLSAGFQLFSGTLIGTIIAEVSFDGGTTWSSAFFINSNLTLSSSIVFTVANTAQAGTILMQGGATNVRVRVSAFTSGTANLTLSAVHAINNSQVVSPTDGFKRTYSASIVGLVVAATPTDIFTITGAANVIVRVNRIVISATRSSNGTSDLLLVKRSTANTLGVSSTPTRVPYDSNSPAAAAVVRAYTANPTLGTLVGIVYAGKFFIPTVSSATPKEPTEIIFGKKFGSSVILRGASDVLAVNLNSITLAGNNFDVYIEWTEEPVN